MSVSSLASRVPGATQARNVDSGYARPAPLPAPAFSPPPPSHPHSQSQSQLASTVRPAPAGPLSSDDRSAAIADYVQRRRQAKDNAEAIRTERAREAERRQLRGRGTASSSDGGGSSPSVPRSGIVSPGAASSSPSSSASPASSASSAAGSRQASRGRDSQQPEWHKGSGLSSSDYSRGEADNGQEEREEDEDEDEDAGEPLHRYAKPPSRTTTTATAAPYQQHKQPALAAQAQQSQQQSHQPRPSARPLSPSAASTASPASRASASASGPSASAASLQSRVSELESEVAALHSQQRLFLAFMETTQSQLAMVRAAASAQYAALEVAGSARSAAQSAQQQPASTQRSSQAAQSAAQGHGDAEHKEHNWRAADKTGRRSGQADGRGPHEQRYRGRQGEREEQDDQQDQERSLSHDSRLDSVAPSTAQRAPPPRSSADSSRTAAFAHSTRPASRPDSAIAQQTSQPQQRQPTHSPPPRLAADDAAGADGADGETDSPSADPFPLQATYPCPDCGRSFNEAALERHVAKALCQKAARRPFDPASQRLHGVQAELSQVKGADRRQGGPAAVRRQQQQQQQQDEVAAAAKQSKWRQERARLQEAIQAGKQISQALREGKPLSSIPVAASSLPDDRVQCPHCLRKFAEHTADRHIPHCKNTQSRMTSKQANGAMQKRRW